MSGGSSLWRGRGEGVEWWSLVRAIVAIEEGKNKTRDLYETLELIAGYRLPECVY